MFIVYGIVSGCAIQMQAPPTTPRGGAAGDAATPPEPPAQSMNPPKPRAAATKRRPSPPLLETPAKRTRGAAPATTTEEKLTGDADDARAQARQKFASQDFVGAAALFAEHAAACRDPKDASKARADEAAAWLSAGVAEPANRRAHAEKAYEATQAALALDPSHVRARLRLGKVYVLLGDLDKAREALSSLADHPDASVARDARKAHARLSPQRNPMGSPPSTRTRLRRLAAAQHLAALGLAPEQCSTPNVKTAHRTIVARVDTKSKQPQTAATRARLRAAQEAYDTLVDGASRERYLWKFEVIGRKVDLGAKHGGAALVVDYDEPTDTHVVEYPRHRRRANLRLRPPDEAPSQTEESSVP
jgi:tetratricopeptide (TPR) repeat protein